MEKWTGIGRPASLATRDAICTGTLPQAVRSKFAKKPNNILAVRPSKMTAPSGITAFRNGKKINLPQPRRDRRSVHSCKDRWFY